MNDKEQRDLKRFLFPDEVMDQEVSDHLHLVSTAERLCRLKYRVEKETKDLYLQIHRDRILVISNSKPEIEQFELKNERETESFCLALFNCESKKTSNAQEIPALIMSKRKFEQLKNNAQSLMLRTLVDSLASETGDDDLSIQLARVLKYYVAEGELRLCTSSESGWRFQNAAYISDRSSGWLLRMSSDPSKDWIIALPTSKEELCGSVTEWVLHSAAFPIRQ